ncbi:MAG TPA: lipopolysaccharide transport periplasmic protein LptA [Gammaproteobacteria bacterium]|nr:lipopolysaccharide transport periplasmic protein LptA [Gammaproteobacteria bacterium]
MRHRRWVWVCVPALLAGPAWALSSDREQPIHIEADSVLLDDARGVAVYRGNVRFTQGSTRLNADEVTLHSGNRKELDRVVAVGRPATFRQRPDKQKEEVRGQAMRIDYSTTDAVVVLTEQARLWQAGNEFSGHRIEYETLKETVKGYKKPDGGERVHVIIQPRLRNEAGDPP